MAWRRSSANPFSEPMVVSLLMHIVYTSLDLNELNEYMNEWYIAVRRPALNTFSALAINFMSHTTWTDSSNMFPV